MPRKLDIVVPSFNRPAKLFAMLQTGLALNMPGVYFVVIDDGSTVFERIGTLGLVSTKQVCEHFNSPNILYIRNPENIGLARSWVRYFSDYASDAEYTVSLVDKDIFVDGAPILRAIATLDANPNTCMIVLPILQKDRVNDNLLIDFDYQKMSGKTFISHFVHDDRALQHLGGYAIKRVSAIKAAGLPRDLRLRDYGLDDMFGIDIDLVLTLAAQGDVDFEMKPHVKRSILEGGTEKYPLTFAYTYYQYAKRTIDDLRRRDMISAEDARDYLGWWHLLILRGLVVAYRPVHGTELERGTSRIRGHLRIPAHLYLLREMRRYGVEPSQEMRDRFRLSMMLMLLAPLQRLGLRYPTYARPIWHWMLRTRRKILAFKCNRATLIAMLPPKLVATVRKAKAIKRENFRVNREQVIAVLPPKVVAMVRKVKAVVRRVRITFS